MRHITIITITLFVCIISCQSRRDQHPEELNKSETLEEKTISGYSSSRGYGDLVEDLYGELVDKSPELKDIENKISSVQNSKVDSLLSFNKYNDKNLLFYSSADNKLSNIKDSLLRQQIKSLLDNSLKKYHTSTLKNYNLIEAANQRDLSLRDLHIILKLYKTIPVIEEYQKTHLPTTQSIENLINNYNKTIQKTESLAK